MKKNLLTYLLLLSLPLGFSCKKIIQNKEQNYILGVMTSGHWYVEQYLENSVDVTTRFTGIEFQFYNNNTVDGIEPASTQHGTWSADINNYSITASFLPAAGDTLALLNYTWKITDSYTDYVVANTATASGTNILHLRKK